MTVATIGHSTRAIEKFIELLRAHGIEQLVDIRTIPRSRHNPRYNRESLPAELATHDIRYLHLPELGGLRHARPDSPNTGWRNLSFRGFADYMQTPEFEAGIAALIHVAEERPTAIMCAEAVPWRCPGAATGRWWRTRWWSAAYRSKIFKTQGKPARTSSRPSPV